MKHVGAKILLLLLLAAVLAVGWMAWNKFEQQNAPKETGKSDFKAVPVEVADIRIGQIELRRTFSGALEAGAEFVVSPKVGGRIKRLYAGLADSVARNDLVAELDSAEYVQEENRSRADLEVARANLAAAESDLKIASRELQRIEKLQGRGVSSESQFDVAMAGELSAQAGLAVAGAEVVSAEAVLETARIHLDYTQVRAEWHGGSDRRVVAERLVDEGETVAAQTPLMSIVELNPIIGVIYVTEKEYARFVTDQPVSLTTDAWPDTVFSGRVDRIAPVFQQQSRQARIELEIDNPQFHLKPGMFIRVTATLDRREDATLVPLSALTRREDETGVFVLADGLDVVRWQVVKTGIRQDDLVEVTGDGLTGKVVILGQQLIGDGTQVLLPQPDSQDPLVQGSALQ